VYPNPADGSLNIRLPKNATGKLMIRNAEGKIMHNLEIEEQGRQALLVDTRHWPSGIYFCAIHGNSSELNRRVSFIIDPLTSFS